MIKFFEGILLSGDVQKTLTYRMNYLKSEVRM